MTFKQYWGALVLLGLTVVVIIGFPLIALVTMPVHAVLVLLGRRGIWRKHGTEFILDSSSFERA